MARQRKVKVAMQILSVLTLVRQWSFWILFHEWQEWRVLLSCGFMSDAWILCAQIPP